MGIAYLVPEEDAAFKIVIEAARKTADDTVEIVPLTEAKK